MSSTTSAAAGPIHPPVHGKPLEALLKVSAVTFVWKIIGNFIHQFFLLEDKLSAAVSGLESPGVTNRFPYAKMSSWVNPFALVSSESEFNQDPSSTPEPREEVGEDSGPSSSATSSGYSSPVFLRYANLHLP